MAEETVTLKSNVVNGFRTFVQTKNNWMKIVIQNENNFEVEKTLKGCRTFKQAFESWKKAVASVVRCTFPFDVLQKNDLAALGYYVLRLPQEYKPRYLLVLYKPPNLKTRLINLYQNSLESLKRGLGEKYFQTSRVLTEVPEYSKFDYLPSTEKAGVKATPPARPLKTTRPGIKKKKGDILGKGVEENLNEFKHNALDALVLKLSEKKVVTDMRLEECDLGDLAKKMLRPCNSEKKVTEPRYILLKKIGRHFLLYYCPPKTKMETKLEYGHIRFALIKVLRGYKIQISKLIEIEDLYLLNNEFLRKEMKKKFSRRKAPPIPGPVNRSHPPPGGVRKPPSPLVKKFMKEQLDGAVPQRGARGFSNAKRRTMSMGGDALAKFNFAADFAKDPDFEKEEEEEEEEVETPDSPIPKEDDEEEEQKKKHMGTSKFTKLRERFERVNPGEVTRPLSPARKKRSMSQLQSPAQYTKNLIERARKLQVPKREDDDDEEDDDDDEEGKDEEEGKDDEKSGDEKEKLTEKEKKKRRKRKKRKRKKKKRHKKKWDKILVTYNVEKMAKELEEEEQKLDEKTKKIADEEKDLKIKQKIMNEKYDEMNKKVFADDDNLRKRENALKQREVELRALLGMKTMEQIAKERASCERMIEKRKKKIQRVTKKADRIKAEVDSIKHEREGLRAKMKEKKKEYKECDSDDEDLQLEIQDKQEEMLKEIRQLKQDMIQLTSVIQSFRKDKKQLKKENRTDMRTVFDDYFFVLPEEAEKHGIDPIKKCRKRKTSERKKKKKRKKEESEEEEGEVEKSTSLGKKKKKKKKKRKKKRKKKKRTNSDTSSLSSVGEEEVFAISSEDELNSGDERQIKGTEELLGEISDLDESASEEDY